MYTEYLANMLGLRLVNNAVGGATTGAYNNSVLNVIGSFPDPRRCQPPGSPPGCPAQVWALPIPARLCYKLSVTCSAVLKYCCAGWRFPLQWAASALHAKQGLHVPKSYLLMVGT